MRITMGVRTVLSVLAIAGLTSAAGAAGGEQDFGFGVLGLAAAGVAGQSENWLDIATQPDGKIVAVGTRTFSPTSGVGTENFFVARFLPSGVLDTSFNGTGTFEFDFGVERYDRATSVSVLPDGKILVGGDSSAWVNIPFQFFVDRQFTSDIALIRLNANGSLDTTFGTNGAVRTDLSNLRDDTVVRVLTLTDGSLRVIGTSSATWAIVAYSGNGVLNTGFGTGGRVTISFSVPTGSRGANDAILQNGKIVITGKQGDFAPIAVARIDAMTGQLDASFGVGGIATVNLPVPNRFGSQSRQGWSLAAQPDGKILVAADGTFFDLNQDTFEESLLTVSRLNADGTTDATFNAFPNDTIRGVTPSIAIVNGDIVLADAFAPRFTLADNGAIAGNFGSFLVGINPLTWTTTLNFGNLAVQSNGGLLAAGTTSGDAAIARFTFDGSQSTPPVVTPPVVTPPPPPPPAPVVTVPLAPTQFSATSLAARDVRLQWRDNATNETSYLVQRSTSANFASPQQLAVLSANANGYTDTSAVARTTYFYRVTARNTAGTGASPILQVTTTRRN